ncbi:Sjogren's syndrome/scleroderma autoantigen 1 family protein [Halalkalicoccus jeotgali]|uniref:Sjogrens syndrome scleroderma autoantigen 1 n=1 Tax=Halalkalicoccus jeotgali (strain DSM 18796 / CECT 7217 / JCM 14584 / KCTC 4019 / B3) TaxID=795797 RepID=D8J4I5_HALJB|nr:Sjogren's syndrome/scleroderma autoantigen 1 family protein [Halalkalicoccus jeotgali]ADJ13547.1 Sjogrens syndrome scleroderma autoantigen 1 [Halalkalicoccus jeotgali B3]ELY32978.1 hypothetical protein C497_18562 [Halalkalicoccus jeotgali B3]
MSEFDKEAEREKLRKKYAEEQQDRQSTQRMSDLLLQGATMTNKHCDTCGDPVFRYDGQEFCPSCRAASQDAETTAQPGSPQSQSPDPSETAPENEAAARAVADEERSDPADTGSQPSEVREPEREAEAEGPSAVKSREATPQTPREPASGDLSGAREELGRTIATLARRAADAEDPRRAREFLEAADEAANTLSTLNGR